jgi:hypothetical protein
MNQPPDDDGPVIDEPPIDPETDTRPLKPLRMPNDNPAVEPKAFRVRRSPATILREATPQPQIDLKRAAPPSADDTDRVRLVPRPPEPPAWRLIMTTAAPRSSTIGLDVREMLTMGRADPDGERDQPDLDLTPHLAIEHGISRLHAALVPASDGLYIIDLESTNGTWLNGGYLVPGERYVLNAGDRLELGLMRLVVKNVSLFTRT